MRYQISGTVMQTVAIDLDPGEVVYSQTNTMCWMNDAVDMNTNTGGGMLAGIGRMLSGGSLFVTDFTARGNGHVAFAPRFPGTILAIQLAPGQSLICRGKLPVCREIGGLRDRLAAAHRRRVFRRPGFHPAEGDRPRNGIPRPVGGDR